MGKLQSLLQKLRGYFTDPHSNLLLWILILLPTFTLMGGAIYRKYHPRFVTQKLPTTSTTPQFQKIAEDLEPPNPDEGLHVVAYTPSGEVSTQVEGIQMLFDHAMVPMTDVDPDKHPGIAMTIQPPIEGEFVWYGTKGFIYRFKNPLPPATSFEVTLPGDLTALDKKSLEKKFKFKFNTPAPQASFLSPADWQAYLPPRTPTKIYFSQAMQHNKVQEGLKCLTWKGQEGANNPRKSDCDLDFQYDWQADKNGGEILSVTPKQAYPLNANFEWVLQKDLAPTKGDLTTTTELIRHFSTSGPMALTQIEIKHPYPATEVPEDLILYQEPEKTSNSTQAKPIKGKTVEGKFPTGDLCFHFTSPLDRASFERSVQVLPLGQVKPDPSFRISYYYENPVTPTEEESEAAETPSDLPHLSACITADLKFHSNYEIRLTSPIKDRNGQSVEVKNLPMPLRFATVHAGLEGSIDLTKNFLNAKTPPLIPFTSMNAERVDIRLVPCALNASNINGGPGSCIDAYAADSGEPEDSIVSPLPVDGAAPKKDPLLRQIAIAADYDAYHHGKIDIGQLYPDLKPGLYELEAVFHPMSEITLKKKYKILGIEQESLASVEPVSTKKRLQFSETALALKMYENQSLIWAVDVATGEPKKGLSLQVWKYETLLATGVTDDEGMFRFVNNTIDPNYDKIFIVADDPQGFGLLSSEDIEGIASNDFGVAYARPEFIKNYFAFLHSDRPLYRPQQTVYFGGFLRGLKDGVYHLPSDIHSLHVTLEDPDGNRIFDKMLPVSATGTFGDQWELGDDNIPRGRYRISASLPVLTWQGESRDLNFTKAFYVASYKKPDFKVSLNPEQKDALSGEPLKIAAKGSYFFGAPLSNAQVEWSIRQDGFRFAPKGYSDYQFVDEEAVLHAIKRFQEGTESGYEEQSDFAGDGEEVSAGVYSSDSESRIEDPKLHPDRPAGPSKTGIHTRVIPATEAALGPDGLFVIETTPQLKDLPSSQIYTATLTAKEWGSEVSAVTDIKVHQSEVYVGLKPQQRVYAKGQRFAIDLVTLTPQGEAAPKQSISLKIFKRDYMTLKKRNEDGAWVFVSEPKDTLLNESSVLTDANGKGVYTGVAEQGGTYRIVASSLDAKGRRQNSAVHVDVGGDNDAAWEIGADNRLPMVPDKSSYKVGDTAQLLIPMNTTGMQGLLTIERAGILEHRLLKFAPNQNMVPIEIREEFIPNVYASLLLFRPQGNESAMMKMGLSELKIEPEKKQLTIELKPEKISYQPKEKVKLSIRAIDDSGNGVPADLIVSVADESVLRLIDYQSPDLMKRFYFNRKLGVTTAENMVHYKSGDAPEADVEKKKRAKFLDTAFFTRSVSTDTKGNAQVEFELPDNITTWVAETFAVSANTQVGSNFTSFTTSLPIFLRPALPRFLAVEDAAQPVIFVENTSEKAFEGSVQMRSTDDLAFSSPLEQNVSVAAGSRTPLHFGLNAIKSGNAKLNFTVKATGHDTQDALEIRMPVEDRSVPAIYSAGGATRAEAVEQMKVPLGARSERSSLEITLGTSPIKSLLQAINYLFEFPYGCAEQRMSAMWGLWQLDRIALALKSSGTGQLPAAFQQVFTDRYPGKSADETQFKNSLNQGISELYEFQKGDGGFSFWKEDAASDSFLSGDMARAFARWSKTGITVDQDSQKRLSDYLQLVLQRQRPLPAPPPGKPDLRQYEADSRAELAWGLASANPEAAKPSLESLLEIQDVLGPRGLAALALAIQAMGPAFDQDHADDLAKLLRKKAVKKDSPQGEMVFWIDTSKVWDNVSMSAIALQALLNQNPKDKLAEATARYLLSQAKAGNFGNTRSTRETLIALAQYSSAQQNAQDMVPSTLAVGTQKKTEALPAYSLSRWLQENFTLAQLPSADQPFEIKISKPEKAPGALYYQANLKAYFPMDLVPRREDGLIISREFYEIDDLREEHPVKAFELGKNYKATMTILAPKTFTNLTVEHLLPAGLEPVDFSLATTDPNLAEDVATSQEQSPAVTPAQFTHEEIHDDRVMWNAPRIGAGIYTIRHVVLAATVGKFQAPGATVFPFYDSDYFGRSRSRVVEVNASIK